MNELTTTGSACTHCFCGAMSTSGQMVCCRCRSTRPMVYAKPRPLAESEQDFVCREVLVELVDRWRAEGLQINSFHATMGTGYTVCADELEALLSTLPNGTQA